MDHKTLIQKIAADSGTDAATATAILAALADALRDHCSALRSVAIPRLGTFTGVKREESIVADPATGRRTLLPPSITIAYTPSQALKNAVKNG